MDDSSMMLWFCLFLLGGLTRGDMPHSPSVTRIEYNSSSFPDNVEDVKEISTRPTAENNGTLINTQPIGIPQKVSPDDVCPNLGVKQVAGTVIKCNCKPEEVLVDGKCQYYHGDMKVPVLEDHFYSVDGMLSDYNVTIRDVDCDLSKYTYHEFSKDQFHIRSRGDVVIKESAGLLGGQRLNHYCLLHHLDDKGDLTWFMKSCVPIPAIPRCCPYGYAMKEGSCQPARTPELLLPDIAAEPFGNAIKWPNITNFLSPVNCTTQPYNTIPFNYKKSNLVSLATGVSIGWTPENRRRVYYDCPHFCVDGIETDNSIEYFITFCYRNPIDHHKEVCSDGPCLRKCCNYGYSYGVNRFTCIKDSNTTFDPPTVVNKSNYAINIGYPLCESISSVEETISIDKQGYLVLKDRIIPSTDYCVDTFINNDHREQNAIACISKNSRSLWFEVRQILMPICYIISLVFLFITITLHLLVPKLLANGGIHYMFHAIALAIAYLSTFSVILFPANSKTICTAMGIMLQFGFLTAFFWLNVMCFEIWRKLRVLKTFHPCKDYSIWYYMMYAWGIPFSICALTIAIQNLVPDNTQGVIKPYIGVSRCWFKEDIAVFVYFYCPVAILFTSNIVFLFLAYHSYKVMIVQHNKNEQKIQLHLENIRKKNASSEYGTVNNSRQNMATSDTKTRQFSRNVHEFKQRFMLFTCMILCWVTEILSWKIPPIELWALTDILNSLQGLFVFIIFLTNRNKLRKLKEKYPGPFKLLQKYMRRLRCAVDEDFPSSPDSVTSSISNPDSTTSHHNNSPHTSPRMESNTANAVTSISRDDV